MAVFVCVCEHGTSKTQQARGMEFGIWSTHQNCRSVKNFRPEVCLCVKYDTSSWRMTQVREICDDLEERNSVYGTYILLAY